MEAPLSSPSLNGPSHHSQTYFTSQPQSNSSSAPTSAPSQPQTQSSQAQSQSQQFQSQTQAQSQSQNHSQSQQTYAAPPAQYASQQARMADTTSPFLRDFNLVAEAAKRAQMAVLMRDMEAVGI